MKLKQTSLHLDPEISEALCIRYPELSISEIVRLCMRFVATIGPELIRDGTRLSIPMSIPIVTQSENNISWDSEPLESGKYTNFEE